MLMTYVLMKRKATIFILDIVLFTIALSLLSFSINLIALKEMSDNNIAFDQGSIYIFIQHETNPLTLADSEQTLDDFEGIIHSLHNLPFSYYEIYQQPLDFSQNRMNDEYYSYTTKELSSSNDQVLSIQISENVQDDFKISVASGRKFFPEDFSLTRGQAIPVLMGSEYANFYSLGDTFSAHYLYSPFTFKIIGFLDSTSDISISVGSTDLDKYIVMPSFSFDYLPATETEYVTQKIHLANKTSGIVRTNEDNFPSGWQEIEQLLNHSDVGDYSWPSSSDEKKLLMMGYNIQVLIPVGFIASILTALSGLLLAKKYFIIQREKFSALRTILVSFGWIGLSLLLSLFVSTYIRIILGLIPSISLYLIFMAIALWIGLTITIYRNNTPLQKS